jgi:alpha-L-rhamnosidase
MNHIMFGEIGAWFYKGLGGILPDTAEPGFRHIRLQPHFVTGLNEFNATHDCPFGTIASHWQRDGDHLTYTATIPAGASATLTLELPGGGTQVEEITSGTYRFIWVTGEAKFHRS